jgi:hypothetical protein
LSFVAKENGVAAEKIQVNGFFYNYF